MSATTPELSEERKRLREIVDRCMPHVKREHIDGVMYQQWDSPFTPSVAHEKLKLIRYRTNDVVSLGWPRCGNHWTYFVLDMILKQSATLTEKSFVKSISDIWNDEEREEMIQKQSPRLFCSHMKPDRIPNVLEDKPRIVYILRNPKDAMVSWYKLVFQYTKEHGFQGTWDEFFDTQIGGEMVFGTWCDHILAMEKYMRDHPEMSFYIHQFEEMREDPIGCVKKLCAFLGYPDDLAEDIVKASNLGNIQTAVTEQKSANDIYFGKEERQQTGWIKKGIVGNWKKTFTVEQNERFNRDFEDKMAGSRLAGRVRKFIDM